MGSRDEDRAAIARVNAGGTNPSDIRAAEKHSKQAGSMGNDARGALGNDSSGGQAGGFFGF